MRILTRHITMPAKWSRLRSVAVSILFLIAAASQSFAAQLKWETLKTERTDVKTVVKDNDTEIKASRGVIVIHTNRPLQVKVYSILGQLVSKETLPTGQSQLPISAHGVYIIKTPDLTCKVAL